MGIWQVTDLRWLSFSILAAVTLVLQTAAIPRLEIQSVRPDLMFILAVHYALWGPWPDAAIAAWVLGLLTGLESLDQIGAHAFCFGLAAWAIIKVRQVVFRDHAVTQFLITFVFTVLVEVAVNLYRRWGVPSVDGGVLWPAVLTAAYTAACAPYLHWLLIRLSRWTGLRNTRGLLTPM